MLWALINNVDGFILLLHFACLFILKNRSSKAWSFMLWALINNVDGFILLLHFKQLDLISFNILIFYSFQERRRRCRGRGQRNWALSVARAFLKMFSPNIWSI